MMKLRELMLLATEDLSGAIGEYDLSAKYIISETLGLGIPELALIGEMRIGRKIVEKVLRCARRRAENEPLQYIFGKAYFRNLRLNVGRGVIIPRPETEALVEIAIGKIPPNSSVCELGAGSGAISLAIASERPDCKAFASEISPVALKYARINRQKLKIKNARFFEGDLFSPFKGKKFDAIIANLPYIRSADIKKLPCEIRNYEPLSALDGGRDGLEIVRKFFREAPAFGEKNAFIIAEISPEQALRLKKFVVGLGAYAGVRVLPDLCGKKRFATANLSP